MLKIIKNILLATLALLFGVILISYYVSFVPKHPELLNSVKASKLQLQGDDVTQLKDLAIAAESLDGLTNRLVRGAYYKLAYSNREQGNKLIWHYNQLLWNFAITLHFSDEDKFYLWCYFAYGNGEEGINAVAQKYFNAPILSLGLNEQAQIVGLAHGSAFQPGTERGILRAKYVLERYNKN